MTAQNQASGAVEQGKFVLRDRHHNLTTAGIPCVTPLILLQALHQGWIVAHGGYRKIEPGVRVTAIGFRGKNASASIRSTSPVLPIDEQGVRTSAHQMIRGRHADNTAANNDHVIHGVLSPLMVLRAIRPLHAIG